MAKITKETRRLIVYLLFAILPWLALTDFYTRGEPREAIVAQTMLAQHNWILPTNNGGEMAYKPPFFHWCVAATSLPFGDVNEWTARFPSAAAAIVMLVWMFRFYRRRSDSTTAMLATLLCLTSFEVWRAAFACRVDMVLTLGIVGALFAFADWTERQKRGVPWLAILMMSLGTLTKGPVAMLLPCAVTGAYLLLRGEGFWRSFFTMAGAGLASLLLPACWYWAAYGQGGDAFLALVREENVDRFLGKMSYASHENPWWYNVEMILAGWLPWTLVVIGKWVKVRWQARKGAAALPLSGDQSPDTTIGIEAADAGAISGGAGSGGGNGLLRRAGSLWRRLRALPTVHLFSLVAFVVIFVFYCIPKSKRGVYLLPVYPFSAWFIALYLRDLGQRFWRRALCTVQALWIVTFAIVLPLMMNPRSDRDIAQDVEKIAGDAHLTSYVAGSVPGNPMHFFTINYYLHDRVGVWGRSTPAAGYILLTDKHVEDFRCENPRVTLTNVYTSSHKSCDTKGKVQLFKYECSLSAQ